jgi:UDP-N-acetylglucosamine acyltransferase
MRIHPTAIVSSAARIAEDVEIGPFTVIEGLVELRPGAKVGGHVLLRGDTVVGEDTHIGWGSVIGADPQDLGFDPDTPSGVRIARGNRIREYVTIHRGSKVNSVTALGEGNYLMTGVHLGHDCRLGAGNVLANNVLLGGHVTLGDRAFLGGGSVVHQFVRVGSLAMMQGISGVSQDVPPYCVAHGVNLLAGLNTVGLRRAGFDAATRAEIKRLYMLLLRAGQPLAAALETAAGMSWGAEARVLLDAVAAPSRKGVLRGDET